MKTANSGASVTKNPVSRTKKNYLLPYRYNPCRFDGYARADRL